MSTTKKLVPSFLVFVFLFAITGCNTIPEDAPSIFFEVQDEMVQIEKYNMEARLPQTTELMKDKFEHAVALLNDAPKLELPYSREYLESKALEEVEDVRKLLNEARLSIYFMHQWDEDISKFTDPRVQNVRIKSLEQKIETLRNQIAVQADTISKFKNVPTVKKILSSYDIPVAFFETNQVKLNLQARKNITSLANTLKKNPSLSLKLMGDSDPRGPKYINNKLALKRAAAVKKVLLQQGIAPEQISIETRVIPSIAGDDKLSDNELLLKRKVVARFQVK